MVCRRGRRILEEKAQEVKKEEKEEEEDEEEDKTLICHLRYKSFVPDVIISFGIYNISVNTNGRLRKH